MANASLPAFLNPVLHQALERRRLKRRSRLCFAGWLVFGAVHIALWWLAYDSTGLHLPNGLLGLAVWPLLLASTGCFIGFISYRVRRLITPMASPAERPTALSDQAEPVAPGRSSAIAPVGV